ncbi:hypothetical protein LCGC14_2502630, partial [marine sediment metagenome]
EWGGMQTPQTTPAPVEKQGITNMPEITPKMSAEAPGYYEKPHVQLEKAINKLLECPQRQFSNTEDTWRTYLNLG